jgi:hypothetical protein
MDTEHSWAFPVEIGLELVTEVPRLSQGTKDCMAKPCFFHLGMASAVFEMIMQSTNREEGLNATTFRLANKN